MRCLVLASVLGAALASALSAQEPQETASWDGVPLRYEVVGDGEPVVVLVHGWSCDRSYWSAQVPALARDHMVVTLDLAGHGGSGADRGDWTIANFGRDVAAVVRALDLQRVVLVGHSMGGPVVVEAARRLGDRVVGIVGVDTFHDLAFRPSPERTQRSLAPLYEDFHTAMDTYVRRFFLPTSDPDLVDRVAEDMAGGPEQVVVGAAEGYYRWWREESETTFADLQVPLFLINAESPSTRVEAARQYMKEVDVEVIPGVGHFVMLEDAPTFNQVLREAVARLASGSAGSLPDPVVRTVTSPDGVPIRYRAAGLDHPEPPIVFVHGWSNQWSVWQPHFDTFARTHPVVAMDLPGFGESGTGRDAWSMEGFGEDVVVVLEDLDLEGAILVGYSMGSAAALESALRAPERVAGVVLVDWLQDPERRYGADVVDAFWQDANEQWGKPSFLETKPPLKPFPDSLIDRYNTSTPDALPAHWRSILQATFQWADERYMTVLDSLSVPLAAINSDHTPTNVEAFREHVPSFELRIMPGLSHLGVMWQDTELFDRHLGELVEVLHATPQAGQGASESPRFAETWIPTPDGLRLYAGILGSGPDTVVVPASMYLAHDLAPLADGRTLIFYDPRGRGASDPVPPGVPADIEAEVRDMETVRAHFGADRVSLIGWSYLGAVVALYAADYPDRVRCVVQIGPMAPRDEISSASEPRGLSFRPQDARQLERLREEGMPATDPVGYCRARMELRSWRTAMARPAGLERVKGDPCLYWNEWPEQFRQRLSQVIPRDWDFSERAREIRAPVLIIHGTEDPRAPIEGGRAWESLIPSARLVELPGVGHVPWAEAPEEFFESVDRFLSGGTAQPQREQEFDARVGEIMRDWGAPGAVITIVKDGDVVLSRGYGTTRVGGGIPVTPSTLASVASVTKTFNATALAMLVDEGLIGWDDPVKKHIPEFEFANAYRTEHTTIRDLITHRAGLPPVHGDAGFAGFSTMDYTIEQLLQDLPTAEPRIAFRERVDYSQVGIALLGEVVARVSGTSWPAFVRARILDALGMDDTYPGTDALLQDHPDPDAVADVMGRAVRRDGRIVDGPWRVVGRIYVPAGGLVTTGEDMAEFMLFLLADGIHDGRQLLSQERITEMHTPQEVDGGAYARVVNREALLVGYGLGWYAHEHRGRKVVEHPGSNFGSSVVALMPEAGIGVFVSSNATYSLDSDRMVSALKFAALDYALAGLDSE